MLTTPSHRPDLHVAVSAYLARYKDQTRRHADQFVWGHGIASIEELGEVRLRAMRTFLDDYDAGKAAGRYVEASLPSLPFADAAFDLALCSHLLFLYSRQFDEAFHVAALRELYGLDPSPADDDRR